MTTDDSGTATRARQWFIASRWQEYEGEARANLLRILCVGAFYIIELINHGVQIGVLQLPQVVDDRFHASMTGLAAAWAVLSLVTLVCLRSHIFPAGLKYATTAGDVALMTAVLMIADGPRSPLVVGYLLIVALAALRLSRGLIWGATVGSMAGYLFLLGYVKYYTPTERAAAMTVPRYHQMIMLLAIALAGVILGQLVRRVRMMAEDFASRVQNDQRRAA